jgi:prevent-host-death family protein
MCYMLDRASCGTAAGRVGVRELRQNLSVYLRRVVAGEALQVTDRGQPVAMLVPLPEPVTTVERLVASGRASPASGDLRALGPPTYRSGGAVSAALDAVRDDRP